MIYALAGDVGSGKSAYLVQNVILPAVAAGRRVFTNVKIRGRLTDNPLVSYFSDLFAVLPAVAMDGSAIVQSHTMPPGSLLVLDEGGLSLMSGLDKHPGYQNLRRFLAQHRHFVDGDGRTCDVWIACQDIAQVSAQAKLLINYTLLLRSSAVMFGFRSAADVRLFRGAVSRDDLGRSGVSPFSRSLFRMRPDTFTCYASHDVPDGVVGMETVATGSVFKGRFMLLGIVFFSIFSFIFAAYLQFNAILGQSAPDSTNYEQQNNPMLFFHLSQIRTYGSDRRLCWSDDSGYIVGCRDH